MGLIYEQVEYDQEKAGKNLQENDWSKKITNGKDKLDDNTDKKEEK